MNYILLFPKRALIVFLFISLPVFSQFKPTFSLNHGPTLLPGGADFEQVGSRYIYQNVAKSSDGIAIDAIVTIVDKVNLENGNSESFIIDSALGLDNRFEPTVNTGPGDGYVEWRIEFVLDGTVLDAKDVGVKARLDPFVLEAIDVDGFEYFEAIVAGSYTIEGGNNPKTQLVVSQNGKFTRFQSGIDFAAGIDVLSTQFITRINYINVNTVVFRTGSSNDSTNRLNSISFLGEAVFNIEDTVQVNTPPIIKDNLCNLTQINICFITNILDATTDVNPNNTDLDISSVRLVDPHNPFNVGNINTPLVVPGVGEYLVDSLGVVTFQPVFGYLGDASILFSVDDYLGVSSNMANLEITVFEVATFKK